MLIMVGLGLSPYLRMDVALFGLGAYLLLSIHTFVAARVVDEFRLSYVAAGPTELRLILIAMTLCMFMVGSGEVMASGFSPFDMFIGGLGSILIILFVVQTSRTARRLLRIGE
jgi:archaetidylinositol phosphate synthase